MYLAIGTETGAFMIYRVLVTVGFGGESDGAVTVTVNEVSFDQMNPDKTPDKNLYNHKYPSKAITQIAWKPSSSSSASASASASSPPITSSSSLTDTKTITDKITDTIIDTDTDTEIPMDMQLAIASEDSSLRIYSVSVSVC
ncbi:Elongator subunit elp2 [Ciborinia camelliae]|nr:Elongator subunit elp2 [Ciborinia camelliae]